MYWRAGSFSGGFAKYKFKRDWKSYGCQPHHLPTHSIHRPPRLVLSLFADQSNSFILQPFQPWVCVNFSTRCQSANCATPFCQCSGKIPRIFSPYKSHLFGTFRVERRISLPESKYSSFHNALLDEISSSTIKLFSNITMKIWIKFKFPPNSVPGDLSARKIVSKAVILRDTAYSRDCTMKLLTYRPLEPFVR